MIDNDQRPVLIRIARLEERLKEKPKLRFAFFKDSSRLISISAFIISIVTTIYSWRKDDIQGHEAARREFDSTMQQVIDIAVKNFEFQVKNKDEKNLGAMNGWFNTQTGLLQNKAIQDLAGLHDASMFDYIVVGNLLAVGQPARATKLIDKAIEIGLQKKKEHEQIFYRAIAQVQNKLFGEKIDVSISDEQRLHDLGSAYTSLGQALLAQRKADDAQKAYEAAIQLFDKSELPIDAKRNQIAMVYKFWADAEASAASDCNSSLAHLKSGFANFPEVYRVPDNSDWNSIQYELSYVTAYCGSDGKLHPLP